MNITRISVNGLFDWFDHKIPLNLDERITIITGPNGFGKTMILRIINALFSLQVGDLERLPFRELNVSFDDDSSLRVARRDPPRDTKRWQGQSNLEFQYATSTEPLESFIPPESISEEGIPFLVHAIEQMIPSLDQVGATQWFDSRTGDVLDLEEVFAEYGDQLPSRRQPSDRSPVVPGWLENIRESTPVRFIGTERLTHPSSFEAPTRRGRRSYYRNLPERTVRKYSDILGQMIQQKLTEYATLSQSLDRTFPARLVEEPNNPTLTLEELRRKLQEVEEKRSRIVAAGLLVEEREGLSVPIINALDESRQIVLSVYASDALEKLSVFDELYARVNSLKRIANTRFLNKQVSVSSAGLKVTALNGSDLELEMLSSGEQHELVLLYDLLFGVAKNSLIMIDEPELSLHVEWQEQVLFDLQEMAKLSDFHVLLATHSPQIIGDNWDLTVDLNNRNM